jgi:acyl-CoA oxidase
MPGVKTGDLGPKLGYAAKDNGWATFDHIRIPRSDMMMGLCTVDKAGKFKVTGDPRVLYIVMMHIRT